MTNKGLAFILQAQCPPAPRPGHTLTSCRWRSTPHTCSSPLSLPPGPTGPTRRPAYPCSRSINRRCRISSGCTEAATRRWTTTSRCITCTASSTTRRRRPATMYTTGHIGAERRRDARPGTTVLIDYVPLQILHLASPPTHLIYPLGFFFSPTVYLNCHNHKDQKQLQIKTDRHRKGGGNTAVAVPKEKERHRPNQTSRIPTRA